MIDSLQGQTSFDFGNQRHRRIAVEFQLKMLQLYGPSLGIYCIPSLSDWNVWNGIIFVRQGYFKDARFKFTLHLHQFPAKQPQLFFLSKLHHALVNPITNELDISSTLADIWCYYTDNMLYNFMKDFKRIFTDKQRLTNRFSYHPAAAELYETNPHEYITKAMQSVSDSLEKMQESQEDWSLKACQPNQETQQIKGLLSDIVKMQHLKLQEKTELFLRKLMQ